MSIIYPTLDFRHKFHQDHIFPKSVFTRVGLNKRRITPEDIDFYLKNYNCLANLQLLEGTPNQEKSTKDFNQWITEKYPNALERKAYMERHYIPDVDLNLSNFREFIEERQKLLISAYKNVLEQKIE